jgi:two-component system, cell cycle response regulator CpdR
MARILIAEDDEPVRGFVKRALEMDGHTIVAECDGAAALDRLVDENGAFDMVLSDIRMPLMDGIALALSAGRDFPHLPILLMTGFADQRERAHDLEAIIEDVVTKPFSLAEIRAAVDKVLKKGKSSSHKATLDA